MITDTSREGDTRVHTQPTERELIRAEARRRVAEAPPLTAKQYNRLAALFRRETLDVPGDDGQVIA